MLGSIPTRVILKEKRIKMTVQSIQGYEVLDNGNPAIIQNSDVWNKHFYRNFDQALEYTKKWLGEYDSLPNNWQGEKYDYSGYGDTIEIRFNSGIEA